MPTTLPPDCVCFPRAMRRLPHSAVRILFRTLPCALAALCALPGCAPERERRNVLLVSIDTLRRDRLGAYGAEHPTPALDALAAEGFLFDDATTTAPTTLPAHSSILTGTYPHRHGVRRNGLNRLPPEALTLTELLRANGYSTGAFVGTAVLDRVYGLDQGFDVYDDTMRAEDSEAQEQRRAERVVESALRWVRSVEGPFFLWVHVFDPHGPYDPPPPFDGMYYHGDPRDPSHRSLEGIPLVFYQNLDGIRDVAYPIAQYDAEVAYTDHQLAKLFDGLGDRLDETAVFVTADHGESLGEQGYWFDHGETLGDACVRVPLLMRAPWLGGGKVVTGPVSHVDILPTVLDVLGLRPLPGAEGTSLLPALASGSAPARDRFLETFLPSGKRKRPLFALASAGFKLVQVGTDPRRRELRTLGDHRADEPSLEAELGARLMEYATREPDVSQDELEMTDEQREKLRALGYVR